MDPEGPFVQDIEAIGFDRPCSEPVGATVELYHIHVVYCGGGVAEEWPAKLEHDFPLFATLKDEYKSRSKSMKMKLRLSICDAAPHPRYDLCNILCFGVARKAGGLNWMSKVVGLSLANFADFFAYLEDGIERGLTVHKLSLPHVFVCCHTTKDERCGYCGPRITDAIREATTGVAEVLKVSHIGGHKYAANVLVYPSGHWWGYVRPADVGRIVPLIPLGLENDFSPETLLPGPPPGLVDLWRGRMGLSKEEQAEITPNSKKGKDKGEKKKGDKKGKAEGESKSGSSPYLALKSRSKQAALSASSDASPAPAKAAESAVSTFPMSGSSHSPITERSEAFPRHGMLQSAHDKLLFAVLVGLISIFIATVWFRSVS